MAIVGNENTLSTFSEMYKIAYEGADKIIFNFQNNLLKHIPVSDGFVGEKKKMMRVTGFLGGYGFAGSNSSLPFSTVTPAINPELTATRFYFTHQLDGEAISAAMNSKGAFAELVKHSLEMTRKSNDNAMSLALIKGDINNDIVLGTIRPSGDSPVTDNSGGSYTVKLVVADFHKQNFHVNQVVEVDTSTDPFLVTAINDDATTPTITIVRQSGSQVPAADDVIYLQGSNGNAFYGLPAITAASGTLYGVAIGTGNQWKAVRDTSGGEVNSNRLFNMCLDIQNQCGEMPNIIACGLGQYKKLNEAIDNKRILNDKSDVMGHGELELMLPGTNVKIIWDRLIENDTIYFINTKHIELCRRPRSGLVDGPNGALHPMHITGADKYLIIYAMYGNIFAEPGFHGVMSGLNV
jgi:hypothetical protein